MHFLIDGYNYLHRANLIGSRPLRVARRALAVRLRPLGRRGDRVTIVWDAADGPPEAGGESAGLSVESVFPRESHRSADSAIVDYVRHAADPGSITVVTDDRDLARSARNLGAKVRSIAQAEALVAPEEAEAADRGSPGKVPWAGEEGEDEKPPPPSPREVVDWLRYFGEEPPASNA